MTGKEECGAECDSRKEAGGAECDCLPHTKERKSVRKSVSKERYVCSMRARSLNPTYSRHAHSCNSCRYHICFVLYVLCVVAC